MYPDYANEYSASYRYAYTRYYRQIRQLDVIMQRSVSLYQAPILVISANSWSYNERTTSTYYGTMQLEYSTSGYKTVYGAKVVSVKCDVLDEFFISIQLDSDTVTFTDSHCDDIEMDNVGGLGRSTYTYVYLGGEPINDDNSMWDYISTNAMSPTISMAPTSMCPP